MQIEQQQIFFNYELLFCVSFSPIFEAKKQTGPDRTKLKTPRNRPGPRLLKKPGNRIGLKILQPDRTRAAP